MNASKELLSRGFLVNEWEVQPLAGSLKKGGHRVHLEPRVMDVLLCLACHHDEVVTRDTLLEEVWGKLIVSDDAINRCISELRTVLGDTQRERTYIRTIPRRGYSLIATVTPLHSETTPVRDTGNDRGADDAGSRPSSIPGMFSSVLSRVAIVVLGPLFIMIAAKFIGEQEAALIDPARNQVGARLQAAPAESQTTPETLPELALDDIRSVAVLPFVNISGDPDHEYFSDGLSEDIRNALMSATELRVAARTSSNVFKNKAMDVRTIGRHLNVDTLLEGTVRIGGEHLRITTQLTDARNGYSIWAASYERDTKDKLALQTEIARQIAGQLAPTLRNTPALQADPALMKGATSNVQAHDYYLLGRHHWHQRTEESLEMAVDYFKKALELDANYALAYSGLSDALVFQTSYGPLAMADIRDEAGNAINRALELEPDLAEAHASYGMFLSESGKPEEARAAYRRAVELKPQYSMAHMWLGNTWLETRDVTRAHAHYRNALRIDPLHPQVQSNYAYSLMSLGRYEEALTILEDFSKINPSEKFLKLQIGARLALGQYDEVLNLVVGHTFSSEYKPYTDKVVIEALIQLREIDKAERILEDNRGVMEDWEIIWVKGSIAVARRDPEGLRELSEFLKSADFDSGPHMPVGCVDLMAAYLHALSAYLGSNYVQADSGFEIFHQKVRAGACPRLEPEIEIAALLYQADSKKRHDPGDPGAARIFNEAKTQLSALRELGWNTPTLTSIEVALHHMSGDTETALQLVRSMVDRGWQPFGLMRTSPLFDHFLSSPYVSSQLVSLDASYQDMREVCDEIALAKLGL